ncbi:hypothetical protein [Timonella sp. A28]|uniref:hypothetical protein n=1 Tax=Timonella sp. A28 TaxID=3442640 RepID=UPI003EBC8188
MDLTQTIVPRSDQLNADDFVGGPRTFTVERVTAGSAEQPVNVHLVELPGRPYKPSKTMRRVLVAAWGKEGDVYAGRQLTLYRDPSVRFGADEVGGIKISHLSHIDKPLKLALTSTRGKKALNVIEPLVSASPAVPVTAEVVERAGSVEELRALWHGASGEVQALIQARVQALQAVNDA